MVTSVGDVSGASGGISAQVAYGNGSVTIDSSGGTVTSSGGRGISAANNGSGAVSVTATGDVQGATYGIYAHSSTGTIDVMSAGVTATAGTAIHAMNSVGGGNVTVAATGDIDATGGSGILAVSTAGAVSITATNVASTGYAAVYGRTIAAQPVTIDVTGDIQGSNVGVFAQATTGAIMIDVGGDINAAYGVTSYGGSSNTVTLNGGTSYGSGRGVQFLNGGTNTLNNNSELSGGDFAVYGTGGNETINNYKTITGNVNLGAGTNAFNNNATFRPGTTVNLGAGNTLTNAGFLSPGGENAVQTTALTGNLVQTSAGAFIVDIDEGGAGADRVTASGTANLAGLVAVNVINLTSASGSVVIASAAALASTATIFTNSGIAFSLEVQGNQLVLSWGGRSILGKLSNLNANQRAVAAYLDALADAGPSAALQVLIDALRDLGETDLLAERDRHRDHLEIRILVGRGELDDGRHEGAQIGCLERGLPQAVAGKQKRDCRHEHRELAAIDAGRCLRRDFGRLDRRAPPERTHKLPHVRKRQLPPMWRTNRARAWRRRGGKRQRPRPEIQDAAAGLSSMAATERQLWISQKSQWIGGPIGELVQDRARDVLQEDLRRGRRECRPWRIPRAVRIAVLGELGPCRSDLVGQADLGPLQLTRLPGDLVQIHAQLAAAPFREHELNVGGVVGERLEMPGRIVGVRHLREVVRRASGRRSHTRTLRLAPIGAGPRLHDLEQLALAAVRVDPVLGKSRVVAVVGERILGQHGSAVVRGVLSRRQGHLRRTGEILRNAQAEQPLVLGPAAHDRHMACKPHWPRHRPS